MTDHPTGEATGRVLRWYLESLVEGGRQLRRITVYPLPFRVGRLTGLGLSLASDSVSKEHAELFVRDGELRVRDVGSKNGTFVNSERVTESPLREGDILHVAQVEFRLGRQEIERDRGRRALEPPTASLGDDPLPQQFVDGVGELPELLRNRQVTTVFQPIVSLPSGALAGYEALGRGLHPRLPEAPGGAAADRLRGRHGRCGGRAERALPREGPGAGADAAAPARPLRQHPPQGAGRPGPRRLPRRGP